MCHGSWYDESEEQAKQQKWETKKKLLKIIFNDKKSWKWQRWKISANRALLNENDNDTHKYIMQSKRLVWTEPRINGVYQIKSREHWTRVIHTFNSLNVSFIFSFPLFIHSSLSLTLTHSNNISTPSYTHLTTISYEGEASQLLLMFKCTVHNSYKPSHHIRYCFLFYFILKLTTHSISITTWIVTVLREVKRTVLNLNRKRCDVAVNFYSSLFSCSCRHARNDTFARRKQKRLNSDFHPASKLEDFRTLLNSA